MIEAPTICADCGGKCCDARTLEFPVQREPTDARDAYGLLASEGIALMEVCGWRLHRNHWFVNVRCPWHEVGGCPSAVRPSHCAHFPTGYVGFPERAQEDGVSCPLLDLLNTPTAEAAGDVPGTEAG